MKRNLRENKLFDESYIVELNYGDDQDFEKEERLFKVFDALSQDARFEKIYDDDYRFDDYNIDGPSEDDWLNGFSGKFRVMLPDLINFIEECEYIEDPEDDLVIYDSDKDRIYDVYSLIYDGE